MALEIPVLVILALMLSQSFAYNKYFMDRNCDNKLVLDGAGSGILELTSSSRYARNMNCFLVLTAPPNQRILVRLLKLDIHSGLDPCSDWIQLVDGSSPSHSDGVGALTGHLCGETEPEVPFASTKEDIGVEFISDHSDNDGGFELLFNTFYMEPCKVSDFTCDNGRCIPGNLECASHDHCADGSNLCSDVLRNVIVIIVGIVACFVVVFAIAYLVKRHRRKELVMVRPYKDGAQSTPLQSQPLGKPVKAGYPAARQNPRKPDDQENPHQPADQEKLRQPADQGNPRQPGDQEKPHQPAIEENPRQPATGENPDQLVDLGTTESFFI
ncbi:uncharacterized protein LOC121388296 isoform X2 [Gigantopelta aegis]|uniref:uncharacterized protein LOC121388296 isoform X2 n=1 Tax=Gigantopelta aegis TaxID=1735272 RepID=UPI001B88D0DB|nr:uncharacterized protein LOC121388296 isoform X2 [Gigantopelta aegis]